MMSHNHAITGAAAWLTTSAALHPHPTVAAAGTIIAWYAARLPDVDNPNSRPAHQLNRIAPGLPRWLNRHAGHRGITHWGSVAFFVGLLIASLFSLVVPPLWWLGLAVGIGWITHILGDCLTWDGAPLLAPFTFRPVRPPYGLRFKVGGRIERYIVHPLAVLWAVAAALAFVSTLFL